MLSTLVAIIYCLIFNRSFSSPRAFAHFTPEMKGKISIHRGKNKKFLAKHTSLYPNRRHHSATGFFFTVDVGTEVKAIPHLLQWTSNWLQHELSIYAPAYKWGRDIVQQPEDVDSEEEIEIEPDSQPTDSQPTETDSHLPTHPKKLVEVVDSGTSGIITVRCYLPNLETLNPVALLTRLYARLNPKSPSFDKSFKDDTLKCSKYFARMIPFQSIVSSSPPQSTLPNNEIVIQGLLPQILQRLPDNVSFKVCCTGGRSNNDISSQTLARELSECIMTNSVPSNPLTPSQRSINLSNPQWTIVVEIIKTWVAHSVIEGSWESKDFWRRGNIGLFIESQSTNQPTTQSQSIPEVAKRKIEEEEESRKKVKTMETPQIHSFFQKRTDSNPTTSTKKLVWKFPTTSLIVASFNNPISLDSQDSKFIAAFDMDGTLITTKSGAKYAKDAGDWQWTFPAHVVTKIRQVQADCLVILTNQGGLKNCSPNDKKVKEFQQRVEQVVAKLGVDNVFVAAACDYDWFRKPGVGMLDYLVRFMIFPGTRLMPCDFSLLDARSFFVGDAAGRLDKWKAGMKKDFADTDRRMAENAGLKFYTPEEWFLDEKVCTRWEFKQEWDPKTIKPTRMPKLSPDAPEKFPTSLIICVGSPASGKSTFAHSLQGVVVNQDTLGSREKCLKAVEMELMAGKLVVVDNTNPERKTRAFYIETAQKVSQTLKKSIPIYCVNFTADKQMTRHNSAFRAILHQLDTLEPGKTLSTRHQGFHSHSGKLPAPAFARFFDLYEKPEISEGFDQVYSMDPWPSFLMQDTPESQAKKRIWNMIY